jgi:hypothetical protein
MRISNTAEMLSGGDEKIGVAPDAPLAVGAAAEDGEDVACVLASLTAFNGSE